MGKILVIGSLNMDLIVRTPRRPASDEIIQADAFLQVPGGKGANQAVAVARMGAPVALLGCIGSDTVGQTLLKNIQAEGIETAGIFVTPEEPTGLGFITAAPNGYITNVYVPGANLKLTPQNVNDAWNNLQPADILVTQLQNPLESILEACQLATQAGIKVILNPSPARLFDASLLPFVDILVPNQNSASRMTNIDIVSTKTAEKAAKKLIELGVKNVIITLGDKGALIVSADGNQTYTPAVPIKIVDTTAAGDAFIAALATALWEKRSLNSAVRMAVAAGAVTVSRVGGQTALPHRTEVDNLLRSI
jgi:ribokinase